MVEFYIDSEVEQTEERVIGGFEILESLVDKGLTVSSEITLIQNQTDYERWLGCFSGLDYVDLVIYTVDKAEFMRAYVEQSSLTDYLSNLLGLDLPFDVNDYFHDELLSVLVECADVEQASYVVVQSAINSNLAILPTDSLLFEKAEKTTYFNVLGLGFSPVTKINKTCYNPYFLVSESKIDLTFSVSDTIVAEQSELPDQDILKYVSNLYELDGSVLGFRFSKLSEMLFALQHLDMGKIAVKHLPSGNKWVLVGNSGEFLLELDIIDKELSNYEVRNI